MFYFSDIKNKKVYSADHQNLGKLSDLIFLSGDKAWISKLVIKTEQGQFITVPIQALKSINHDLYISDFHKAEQETYELTMAKNLLDKQIIDIKGNKIVRVNDIVIGDKNRLEVMGVDVSALGVFRWFNLETIIIKICRRFFNRVVSPKVLSIADIQPLELTNGQVVINKDRFKLEKLRPEDLADYLETTNIKNVVKVVTTLNPDFAAEVIGHLNINYQTALFTNFSLPEAAKVISLIDPDEAVDILLTITPSHRIKIISLLPKKDAETIANLLQLSKTPIGELITSDYFTVSPETTVKQIMDQIRKNTQDFASLYNIYVLNQEQQLIGTFTLHNLLIEQANTPAYKFLNPNVVIIHMTTPKEIAISKMLKYKLQSLPVIDNNKHLLGIVTFDDLANPFAPLAI
jgi:CBS domain-containing protein/sporulation protein YlmC with PRC-barrel domain